MRLLPFLALFGTACEPSELHVLTDSYALEFAGEGCMSASADPIALGTAITIEAWVKGNATPSRPDGAVVALGEAVMLWTDATTTGVTEPAREPVTGFITQTSLYDGKRHHVAATWSQANGGALFIDGLRYGIGSTLQAPVSADQIWVGCYPNGSRYFDGVIDEVRISTLVRYPDTFTVQDVRFEEDDYTLALWHLDTGSGGVAFDETTLFDGLLEGTTWTQGLVRNDPTGATTTGDTGDTGDTASQ